MSTVDPKVAPAPQGLFSTLAVRNFRLLWVGETVSVLGDQFYFVALPWLVLQMTGSGLALGSVLMTAAAARATLMLAGGVANDRFSSRTVMLLSNMVRCGIVSLLTVLVYTHALHLWHLYVVAAAFGTFDAFFYPAYISILPSLLEPGQLTAGNSLMQASVQLTGLIGPAAAGVVISQVGLAAAFGVDAASFLVSISMLALITAPAAAVSTHRTPLASLREGVSYALRHPVIRSLLVASATMSLFLNGPFAIGAPLLAKTRFGGAKALGVLFSSFAAGALTGTIVAGHDRDKRRLGPLLVIVFGAAGLAMIALGMIWHVWISSSVLVLLGLIAGYSNIHMLAYLQRRTAPDKMGRVMSLIMFCGQGLLPLSYIAAGAVSYIGVTALFLASGLTIIVITSFLFRVPQFWKVESIQAQNDSFHPIASST